MRSIASTAIRSPFTPDSILLTGGAGFIGSHIAVEVARAGHRPVVLDNLCNSKSSVIERIARIIGRPIDFVHGDIRDGAVVRKVIRDFGISRVIHLAGLKAVGESVSMPLVPIWLVRMGSWGQASQLRASSGSAAGSG